jgi:hypothetical protein
VSDGQIAFAIEQLKALKALDGGEPSAGRLTWWRVGYDEMASLGHRVAFVFQDPTLMPWARVAVNVRLPLGAVLGTAVIGEPRNAGALFGRTVEDSDRGLFNWAWPLIGIEKFDVPVFAREQQGFWRSTPSPCM